VISGTPTDGTWYIRLEASGDTLIATWISSLTGYAWNAVNNGLYNSDKQLMPYQLVKAGAVLGKRKIMNLWQGGGFQTVGKDGAVSVASINTGSGARTFDQGVETTDSPTFVDTDTLVNGAQFFSGGKIAKNGRVYSGASGELDSSIFQLLDDVIPTTGYKMLLNGGATIANTSVFVLFSHAERFSTTEIRIYGIAPSDGFVKIVTIEDTTTRTFNSNSIYAW